MRLKKFLIVILVICGIFLVDFLLAGLANLLIVANDADFEEEFSKVELDYTPINDKVFGQEICTFKYKFFVYGYQTCFVPRGRLDYEGSELGYVYMYHKPRPKLAFLFPGYGPDNYYYRENYLGEALRFIPKIGYQAND
ncbi:hypothetical protein [uncultured Sneathiella sp.]|uniref:hypothetical protein n=1 Tax=uncultured Sneathiella sp. TaxID=879315 RepID=UPI002596090B|nr:hypothetical protein [uncultured Sneathiella sp.]